MGCPDVGLLITGRLQELSGSGFCYIIYLLTQAPGFLPVIGFAKQVH